MFTYVVFFCKEIIICCLDWRLNEDGQHCKSQQPRSAVLTICQRNGTQVCTLFALPATIILASASCWWFVKIGRPKAPRNLWSCALLITLIVCQEVVTWEQQEQQQSEEHLIEKRFPNLRLILIITLQLPSPPPKKNTKYSTWNVSSQIPDCVTGQVGTPSLVFVPAFWPFWGWDLWLEMDFPP